MPNRRSLADTRRPGEHKRVAGLRAGVYAGEVLLRAVGLYKVNSGLEAAREHRSKLQFLLSLGRRPELGRQFVQVVAVA